LKCSCSSNIYSICIHTHKWWNYKTFVNLIIIFSYKSQNNNNNNNNNNKEYKSLICGVFVFICPRLASNIFSDIILSSKFI
ncbi:MAG: hypothetical protein N7Q72_01950, partial [Spiroplasma sp. Tabriz.8]|nr:hypothetical protein [Spiroplasma sp. Tabriz.8]